jgi:hypothetical protein
MHRDDTVIDFTLTPQPLPRGTNRLLTALGRSRFIEAADRLGVAMLARHQLLALVAHCGAIPLD